MSLDAKVLLSNKQAITATAASTDVFDFGAAADFGAGGNVPMLVQVTEDFNNLTSLTIAVQASTDAAFTSPITLVQAVVPLASLKAGYQLPIHAVPHGQKRYMRTHYTVTGTAPTTGKVTAGVTSGVQMNG